MPEENAVPAPPLPPKPGNPKPPTPADEGMTLGDLWSKVTNYRFSSHAFAGIATAAVATYFSSPELQDAVNGFAKAHKTIAILAATGLAIWRNYSSAQKALTMTTTIQPGETGASAAVASATEEK